MAHVFKDEKARGNDIQEQAAQRLAVRQFLGMAGVGWTGTLTPTAAGDPIPINNPPQPWDQPAWSTAHFDSESEWFRETAPGGVG